MSDAPAALREGLAALSLPEGLSAPLLTYLDLLQRWNRTYNLTAIRDLQTMVSVHLIDSLSLVPYLGHIRTLADLGTGPGLPGIPLALALPSLQVTLVESNGKKARFLREVVRSLQLANAEVVQARAEAVNANRLSDAITARALGSLADILAIGGHLLAPHGQLLAMKGTLPQQEIAALPPEWAVNAIHRLTVPGLGSERHLLIISRAVAVSSAPTPHLKA